MGIFNKIISLKMKNNLHNIKKLQPNVYNNAHQSVTDLKHKLLGIKK